MVESLLCHRTNNPIRLREATNINPDKSSDTQHFRDILALGRNGRISSIFGVFFGSHSAGIGSYSYNAVIWNDTVGVVEARDDGECSMRRMFV